MTLHYPNGPTMKIVYEFDEHVKCANDAEILEKAKEEYKKTLGLK